MDPLDAVRTFLCKHTDLTEEQVCLAEEGWISDGNRAGAWPEHLVELGVLGPETARMLDMIAKGYMSADVLQLGRRGIEALPSARNPQGSQSVASTSSTSAEAPSNFDDVQPGAKLGSWLTLERPTPDSFGETVQAVCPSTASLLTVRILPSSIDIQELLSELPSGESEQSHLLSYRQLDKDSAPALAIRAVGPSLGQLLRNGFRATPSTVEQLVSSACTALHHLWSEDMGHGALHPDNLWVSPQGEFFVSDAGLRQALAAQDAPLPARTTAFLPEDSDSRTQRVQDDAFALFRIATLLFGTSPEGAALEEHPQLRSALSELRAAETAETFQRWKKRELDQAPTAEASKPAATAEPASPRRTRRRTEQLLQSLRDDLEGAFAPPTAPQLEKDSPTS